MVFGAVNCIRKIFGEILQNLGKFHRDLLATLPGSVVVQV